MLNRSDAARNSITPDYDIGKSPWRRSRRPHERKILAAHRQAVRIIALVGTLTFSGIDYVSRQLAAKPRPQFVIFDLRRVAAMTRAGARLLAEEFRELARLHVTVILSGIKRSSTDWKMIKEWTGGISNLRDFYLLDAAIEWAEDQVVIAMAARSISMTSPNYPNSRCLRDRRPGDLQGSPRRDRSATPA